MSFTGPALSPCSIGMARIGARAVPGGLRRPQQSSDLRAISDEMRGTYRWFCLRRVRAVALSRIRCPCGGSRVRNPLEQLQLYLPFAEQFLGSFEKAAALEPGIADGRRQGGSEPDVLQCEQGIQGGDAEFLGAVCIRK
jgi:hypothetical protein